MVEKSSGFAILYVCQRLTFFWKRLQVLHAILLLKLTFLAISYVVEP